MHIKPIRTKADHKATLKEVSRLVDLDPARGTLDGDRLDVLSTLVAAYEAKHYPVGPADPVEAIKFRMEQQGLAPRDLTPMLGQLNRVYEVLAGRRPLTLAMIWRLHTQLGIPAESLIRPPVRA
jgi:HTH-type transcriptional regulator / antitoxin HigA